MTDPASSHPPSPRSPARRPRAAQPPRARRAARLGGGLLTLASVLGLLTVVGSSCRTEPRPTEAPALGASLELAAGSVTLITADGPEPLLSNTPLPLGAQLATGAGSRALIRLGDGTRVFMRDETELSLGDGSSGAGGLILTRGHVWVEAPPLEQGRRAVIHQIDHPSGAVEVAVDDGGASLSRTGDAGEIEVYVADGLAIVTAPAGRTELRPGERARIAADGQPQVEPVKFWDDWTGGMGDHGVGDSPAAGSSVGSGSLYAIDHMAGPNAPAVPLAIQRQSVKVVLDQDVAETAVEQVFFNPASGDVEGWYWFTVPDDAIIVGFALETPQSGGKLVEAEVVERKQAAQSFEANIERRVDPALLEWVDARTVRARIYPIPGAGTRRIVLRYQQLLTESEGKLRYRYPMAPAGGAGGGAREAATIEELAIEVQLRGAIADRYGVATRSDARYEPDNRRVTLRRSGYTPRSDFELELTRKREVEGKAPAPLRVNLLQPGTRAGAEGSDEADYVLLRWVPDVEFTAEAAPKAELAIVVDTSAGGDPSEHQAKLAVAEALLRSLSPDDAFVLIGADLSAEVLYPTAADATAPGTEPGLAQATPEAIEAALDRLAARRAGGATDLGAIFEGSLARLHGRTQPAIVYIGDGQASSGELGGEALAERLRRTLASSPARLFTVAVGRDVDDALLRSLARVGGGRSLRVEDPSEAVVRALELSGALKTPTLTDLRVDLGEGLDDVFTSAEGKLARGEALTILARTHYALPEVAKITFAFAGQTYEREYPLVRDEQASVLDALVPRLWANAYVDRLLTDARGPEAVRGKILTLGLDYGLMTPFTSWLALEDEAAYRRAGIQRRQRGFPILTDASGLERGSVSAGAASTPAPAPTVLSMIGAAASAPFGCVVAPEPDGRGELRSSQPARELGVQTRSEGRSETRGPAPSALTPTDARLEPVPEGEPGWASASASEGAGARALAGLGVVKLDAGDELAGGAASPSLDKAASRSQRLAAAGYRSAPPAWVEEITESELARGGLSGRALPASPIPHQAAIACSDASTRSLGQRRLLWERRLDRQTSMAGMLRVYEASAAACELPRWRDQRAFLDLLQLRARTEAEIELLLGHFSGGAPTDADARLFLIQQLQRRLIEPALLAVVNYASYGGVETWWEIDRRLDTTDDPDERLRILDAALAQRPGDPDGERRMLAELLAQGRRDPALARGLRLRDQGQLTLELLMFLGEQLVAAGREAEAKRLYSELVEFAPQDLGARLLLGDLFLRHGWREDAYRQYALLLELELGDGDTGSSLAPEIAIRMARAAASTDEALRLLGRVQAGDGRPGEDDPRRWARAHAAAILAVLIDDKVADPAKLSARLDALGLFDGPGTWELLLWHDLGARLTLADPRERGAVASDSIDASRTGLVARQYSGEPPELVVRHSGLVPDRTVAWSRIRLRYDGSSYAITRSNGQVEAKVAVAEPAAEPGEGAEGGESGEGTPNQPPADDGAR